MIQLEETRLAIVGLGYVGLPLAVEFGKQLDTLGFDINAARITALREGRDSTREVAPEELAAAGRLRYTSAIEDLRDRNVYIITVPTPIDEHHQPDLRPLCSASETVGRVISTGDVVIYESTVYPGATEEVCVPVIERVSGLRYNQDFYAGYSPERINPGDREHRVSGIVKVTSGSTPEVGRFVDDLYRSIITAGTYPAGNIRIAEAAKVIENTQRDVNIALINELAMLFERLGLDTEAVLKAAGTKWNFLPFRPGLVGGHCIGVDPYYLTHKAQAVGHHPEMILAGRRINDGMGNYVAAQVIKLMTQHKLQVVGSNVLIMGLTFKENCPDLRNTRVVDIIAELREYNANVEVYDPNADPKEAGAEYGLDLIDEPRMAHYDAVILAVAHDQFRERGVQYVRTLLKPAGVLYDIKYVLPRDLVDGRL
ncbi:MAG TPA: Vi polysaccharide biosynthesis UDP-N-acetylglucosamine C-6 dehydrogenase TviB [Nitrococcus sp.]|nr:Vi polysaccharide biosynthesis UDP-N-acetylglucosamine C-6 dehydrogenase TviB [Nitrococcus sp.]